MMIPTIFPTPLSIWTRKSLPIECVRIFASIVVSLRFKDILGTVVIEEYPRAQYGFARVGEAIPETPHSIVVCLVTRSCGIAN